MTKPIEDSANASAIRTALDVPTNAALAAKYTKPANGIPASDLDADPAGRTLLTATSAAERKQVLGLDQVNNTSDANKPVSDAQATAIAAKMNRTLPALQTVFDSGTAAQKATFQASVSGAFGVAQVKRRILQSLQLGLDRTQGVAATPPTATEGAANANSTLITTVSVYGVPILPTDARIRYIGTVINAGSSGNFTGNHINETSGTCANGWGASIGTDATSIELCVRDTSATRFRMRWREIGGFWQWASASDVVLSTTAGASFKFYRWDFGSSAPREIEVYFAGSAQFRGFVVSSGIGLAASSSNTARAWAPGQTLLNAMVLGDSYTYGVGSTGCRDTWVHKMGEALGIQFTASGAGGQGYLALSNTGAKKARDRISDIDVMGQQDLIVAAWGINDYAQTAAPLQAEVSAFWTDAMVRQPNAVILHLGPWTAPGKICPTTIETAIQAGFNAVADTKRMAYIPILSEGWQSTDTAAGSNMTYAIYGASGESPAVHVNNAGHAYLGLRAAAKVRQSLYALAST